MPDAFGADQDTLRMAVERANKLEAEVARLRLCISFLSSAIKSGEPWTDECEEMVNDALNPKGRKEKLNDTCRPSSHN
jgi:hypothetical protein